MCVFLSLSLFGSFGLRLPEFFKHGAKWRPEALATLVPYPEHRLGGKAKPFKPSEDLNLGG